MIKQLQLISKSLPITVTHILKTRYDEQTNGMENIFVISPFFLLIIMGISENNQLLNQTLFSFYIDNRNIYDKREESYLRESF